jgi:hypothetical protein
VGVVLPYRRVKACALIFWKVVFWGVRSISRDQPYFKVLGKLHIENSEHTTYTHKIITIIPAAHHPFGLFDEGHVDLSLEIREEPVTGISSVVLLLHTSSSSSSLF